MTSEQSESNKPVYRTIFGAEVLWPLDCPDDILDAVIKEIKKQETDNKLQLDKDGLQVISPLARSQKT
jgi:hypothetical protein